MQFREARLTDMEALQYIRNAVKENQLSNPALVTNEIVANYLTQRGKGWVCTVNEKVVGFGIIDFFDPSIWALFLLAEYEGKGIGKTLMQLMLDDYFSKHSKPLWLTTSPQTRAETFYRLNGWRETGTKGQEIKFELSREDWELQRSKSGKQTQLPENKTLNS